MVFISRKNKFIFIHIPKNCGKTIRKTLNKNLKNDFNVKCNTLDHLFSKRCLDYNDKMINPLHYSIYDINNLVDDTYFVCAFCRNPYDRFYSLYLHLLQEFKEYIIILIIFNVIFIGISIWTFKKKPNTAKWIIFIGVLINIFVIYRTMYPEIIYELCSQDFSSFMIRNFHSLYHTYHNFMKPQYNYIIPEKTDFIGREENFTKDFKKILKRLGIKSKIQSTNVKNLRKTGKTHKKYKYINKFTPDIIKLVNKIYKKDFKIFGYKMLKPDELHKRE